MIRGVVFDMDGTLIDTVDIIAHAWEYAFKAHGIDVKDADVHRSLKGADATDFVASLGVKPEAKLIGELKRLRKESALKELALPTMYPDAMATLEELRSKGLKLAIATSMSHDMLEVVVSANRLGDLMEAVVSTEDVARGKPSPDVFLEAFRRIKVNPKDGAVVGDSRRDIIPANEIGAFSVYIDREGEMDCAPNAVIKKLAELPKVISNATSLKKR